MGISPIAFLITMGIHWFNQRISEKLPTVVRNYTTKRYITTPQTVIRLPDNIDRFPVKIKKILNISRDFIEISEYCDEMIEYNNYIIKKFYVPDSRKLIQRPIHRVPVYYRLEWTRDDANSQLKILSINLNETYQLLVQIAINNETEIIQLKKIKDILLKRTYLSKYLDLVKKWNSWALEKFYKEKPKAKEDELLPSSYYWPQKDPEIDYDYGNEDKDIVYGFGDAENRVFMVAKSVLDKENDLIDDISEGISQTINLILNIIDN